MHHQCSGACGELSRCPPPRSACRTLPHDGSCSCTAEALADMSKVRVLQIRCHMVECLGTLTGQDHALLQSSHMLAPPLFLRLAWAAEQAINCELVPPACLVLYWYSPCLVSSIASASSACFFEHLAHQRLQVFLAISHPARSRSIVYSTLQFAIVS